MPLSSEEQREHVRGLYLQVFDNDAGRMVLAHLEHAVNFAAVGLQAEKNNALGVVFHAGKAWTVQYIKDIVSVGFDEEKGETYGGPDD